MGDLMYKIGAGVTGLLTLSGLAVTGKIGYDAIDYFAKGNITNGLVCSVGMISLAAITFGGGTLTTLQAKCGWKED
jgi:hypothetical protein